ncbi:ArsR/SmtB family transcription factor [Nocardia testacea]|uniref:ArsR/SmtB family transcription factor n=1 Tax=Nocardia testacea TaxID=248551 RepID=UPI00031012EF|nr:metalloregulator ArsR/SmtB family transcription factor [Nocardia testacea]
MTPTVESVLGTFTECQPLFTALGDDRRQAIIALLLKAGGEASVGEIAGQLGLSQPAVSHHLKILRAARLLTVERRGTLRCYALNGAELTDLLAPLRELVDQITACADQPGIHERDRAGTTSVARESSPK